MHQQLVSQPLLGLEEEDTLLQWISILVHSSEF